LTTANDINMETSFIEDQNEDKKLPPEKKRTATSEKDDGGASTEKKTTKGTPKKSPARKRAKINEDGEIVRMSHQMRWNEMVSDVLIWSIY